MKVLVTGATGFTGALLTEKLCRLGCRVMAIHRRDNIPESLRGLAIGWLRGNVYDPDLIRRACRGVEYIFHVAAAYREAGIPDETYRKVHVESTQQLARAALAEPALRRFIHVSTVGVHGHVEQMPADENAPLHPGDIYQRTKAEAEVWIRDFARQERLPLTVIRPTAILGPGDRRLLKVFQLARLPVVPILGFGKGYYHLIHVEDLTDAMLLAAEHPGAEGEVFICGNSEPIRLRDMLRVIGRQLGREPRFLRLPAWPFFAAGWLCEAICRPLQLAPPIYPRRVAFFTKDRAFDTSKLHHLLGFQERYDNLAGLRQTCDWYLRHGWLRR